jgi:NAD(P)-dependent dehydrogenase (short-subunit alcohol dehydrogenase family)
MTTITGVGAYSAAKFGVTAIGEALRTELAPMGVGVTVLVPGYVHTNLAANTLRVGGEPRDEDEGPLVREGMRQRQLLVGTGHFVVAVVAGDQVDVEGPRAPVDLARAVGRPFQFLPAAQPRATVQRGVLGDHDGVQERALLDAAPRGRFVHG